MAGARSAAAVEGKRLGVAVLDSGDVGGITGLLEQLWRNGSPQPPPSRTAITYGDVAVRTRELLTGERFVRMTPGTDDATELIGKAALPYA